MRGSGELELEREWDLKEGDGGKLMFCMCHIGSPPAMSECFASFHSRSFPTRTFSTSRQQQRHLLFFLHRVHERQRTPSMPCRKRGYSAVSVREGAGGKSRDEASSKAEEKHSRALQPKWPDLSGIWPPKIGVRSLSIAGPSESKQIFTSPADRGRSVDLIILSYQSHRRLLGTFRPVGS